ncbi:transcription antitermination factor NusB [Guggenheimella bovis]
MKSDSRKNSREELMKHFYAMDMKNEYGEEELEVLLEPVFKERERNYIEALFRAFTTHREEIDQKIEQASTNWSLKRIGRVERAILRVSTTELLYLKEIPTQVSISEALELSKTYCDEKSTPFINGVLGKIADEDAISQ